MTPKFRFRDSRLPTEQKVKHVARLCPGETIIPDNKSNNDLLLTLHSPKKTLEMSNKQKGNKKHTQNPLACFLFFQPFNAVYLLRVYLEILLLVYIYSNKAPSRENISKKKLSSFFFSPSSVMINEIRFVFHFFFFSSCIFPK